MNKADWGAAPQFSFPGNGEPVNTCGHLHCHEFSDCHTLPDSTNGRVTDSKILRPFVSVCMRFLSVPHAVNAVRVR